MNDDDIINEQKELIRSMRQERKLLLRQGIQLAKNLYDVRGDNARLRELIKSVEFDAWDDCPFCKLPRKNVDNPLHQVAHSPTCPAFNPDGTLK